MLDLFLTSLQKKCIQENVSPFLFAIHSLLGSQPRVPAKGQVATATSPGTAALDATVLTLAQSQAIAIAEKNWLWAVQCLCLASLCEMGFLENGEILPHHPNASLLGGTSVMLSKAFPMENAV